MILKPTPSLYVHKSTLEDHPREIVTHSTGFLTIFPAEILLKILQFGDVSTLLQLRMVSKFLKQMADDNIVWKYHCIKDFDIEDTTSDINWRTRYIEEFTGGSFSSCSNFIKQKFLAVKASKIRPSVRVYFVNLMDKESCLQAFGSILSRACFITCDNL